MIRKIFFVSAVLFVGTAQAAIKVTSPAQISSSANGTAYTDYLLVQRTISISQTPRMDSEDADADSPTTQSTNRGDSQRTGAPKNNSGGHTYREKPTPKASNHRPRPTPSRKPGRKRK